MNHVRVARYLVLLAVALPAAAQNTNDPREAKTTGKSDWELQQDERNWKEGEVALPAAPRSENLIEFFPSPPSSFHFYIDSASVSVDGSVIRYTIVARSPSGYDNVTYEGLRCKAGAERVYAYLHGGAWSRQAGSDWKPIDTKSVQRWRSELRNRYFCPVSLSIMTRAEGLEALRRGGHPLAKGTGDPERY